MDLYTVLNPDFRFEDERGALVQLVSGGYEQVNVLTTRAGVVRGGHFHKETTEAFYVVNGAVTVTFERNEETRTETFTEGMFFCVNPFVVHTMAFAVDTTLVALYARSVERKDGTKDIYRREEAEWSD